MEGSFWETACHQIPEGFARTCYHLWAAPACKCRWHIFAVPVSDEPCGQHPCGKSTLPLCIHILSAHSD